MGKILTQRKVLQKKKRIERTEDVRLCVKDSDKKKKSIKKLKLAQGSREHL